jgi:hypothetical protein
VKSCSTYLRSSCALGIVSLFVLFLISSAPHRVHHLLENVPAPKSEQSRVAVLSIAAAPAPQDSAARSADSQAHSSAPKRAVHDHSSHSHRHRHGHSHSHSHTHAAASVQTQTAAAVDPSFTAEPRHANAPKRDAHHDGSARTDCIVQAAAQQAQVAPLQSAQIVFLDTEFALRLAVRTVNFTPFDPSPLSQRAPPQA